MSPSRILTVYLPERLLTEPSGFLVGCTDPAGFFCCVTARCDTASVADCFSVPVVNTETCTNYSTDISLPQSVTCGVVGVWMNETFAPRGRTDSHSSAAVSLNDLLSGFTGSHEGLPFGCNDRRRMLVIRRIKSAITVQRLRASDATWDKLLFDARWIARLKSGKLELAGDKQDNVASGVNKFLDVKSARNKQRDVVLVENKPNEVFGDKMKHSEGDISEPSSIDANLRDAAAGEARFSADGNVESSRANLNEAGEASLGEAKLCGGTLTTDEPCAFNCDEDESFIVILIDLRQFGSSAFLADAHPGTCVYAITHSIGQFYSIREKVTAARSERANGELSNGMGSHPKSTNSEAGGRDQMVDLMIQKAQNVGSLAAEFFHLWMYFLVGLMIRLVTGIGSFRMCGVWVVQRVLFTPSLTCQLRRKFNALHARHSALNTTPAAATDSKLTKINFTNEVCCAALDVSLGAAVAVWLLRDSWPEHIAACLAVWAETVAAQCEALLHWLMGVPAGLKLNEPLDHFLGNFFLYHIYLWKAYLEAIQQFLVPVLEGACLTGLLGASVQLSAVRDLLSMMTLHIYCFYVYAARLYSLQLYALGSLWRLFRGRKWNVLRRRVDSATYDVHQLYAGTLLFTVLLFLLPTTAFYYSVFALLRVVVLALQGVLYRLVSLLDRLPLYWLLLRVLSPSTLARDPVLSIVHQQPLCLRMQLRPVSLARVLRPSSTVDPLASRQSHSVCTKDNSWITLTRKLLLGQLIYPWIESGLDEQS